MTDLRKLRGFADLAGRLTHEMNNDLAAVLGYAEMIIEELGPDDPFRAYADEIFKAGTSTKAAINRLDMLRRIAIAGDEPFDLRRSAERVRSVLSARSANRIEMKLELPESPLMTVGDPREFEPLIRDLCQAAKTMIGSQGKIRMVLEAVHEPAERRLSHGKLSVGAYTRISVHATAPDHRAIDQHADKHVIYAEDQEPDQFKGDFAGVRGAMYLLDGALHVALEPGRCGRAEVYFHQS